MATHLSRRISQRIAASVAIGAIAVGCGGGEEASGATGAGASTGAGGGGGGSESLRIEAPLEQWTWIPFDDALCANGTPTGLAVNLTDRSPNAVLFLMGGGACWSYATCYESDTATFVASGFGEANMPFLTIAAASVGLLNRDDPSSPFRDYSVVAMPYCTGDAFTGTRTTDYEGRATMHVGHENVKAYLRRIVPTFSDAERIVLLGVSAGGIGAGLNWWHVQQAFGDVRVDLVDDSGPPLPPPYLKESIEQTWRDAWGLDAALPPGCQACKDDLDALVDWVAAELPASRGALLAYTNDPVLASFLGVTTSQFAEGLDALAATRFDPHDNLGYFFAEGTSHVLLPHPDLEQSGVRLWDWLGTMLRDDPSWSSVRP